MKLSRRPIPEIQAWRGYDEAPTAAVVRPVRVLQVTGGVTNPDALTNPGSGQTTTLDYPLGGTAPSLILDYGKEVGGTATFEVRSTSGTTIQATYSEALANLGSDLAGSVGYFYAGNPERTDTFSVGGPGVATAPLIQGGERYEQVTLTAPGSVDLSGAGINFSPLRQTPNAMPGHFLSSDELLNRIWYAGAYTLNLNQLTPGTTVLGSAVNRLHLLLDGAKRDRAVWSGDQMISGLTDYYVSDPVYARDSLALFLQHPATVGNMGVLATGNLSQPGPLPGACTPNPQLGNGCLTWSAGYSMAVIPALYNYYLYTGDREFVRQHWQAVVRQMAWDAQHVGPDGLMSIDSGEGADWNADIRSGELTYINALYCEALQSAAKLAMALRHKRYAKASSAAADRIKRAVNRQLWDPRTGAYDRSTSERGSIVQDANVTAILADIPKPSRARGIARVLQRALAGPFGPLTVSSPAPLGSPQFTSPYIGSFHVLADFAAGNEAAALSHIRQEWGFMIGRDPGGVDWERIPNSGHAGRGESTAHAWSTGPTAALSQYVLGVMPTAPGYARWRVGPEPGDLRWAQGVVPTPHGPIAVRWDRTGGRAFVLTVRLPRHTAGTVAIPHAGHLTIARNGRIVWMHGKATGHVRAYVLHHAVVFQERGGRANYASVK